MSCGEMLIGYEEIRETVTDLVSFLIRHGEAFMSLYGFADQLAVPLPAVPSLLAIGALGPAGKLNFRLALLLSVVATVHADATWYPLGRARRSQVLRLLCKIPPEPDSC